MDGRDVAQFGSALDWGSRGRRFKSGRPDQGLPAQKGFRVLTRSPFPIFGSQTGSHSTVGLCSGCAQADLDRFLLRILFMAVAPVVSAGRISCR
jgi:hypothetical protein